MEQGASRCRLLPGIAPPAGEKAQLQILARVLTSNLGADSVLQSRQPPEWVRRTRDFRALGWSPVDLESIETRRSEVSKSLALAWGRM